MDTAMSVLRLQSCSCPCSKLSAYAATSGGGGGGSASPHPAGGRSNFAWQRVDSNSLAGSRQEFAAPLVHKPKTGRRLRSTTRYLYSPVVESCELSEVEPLVIMRDGGMGGPTLASPSSISFLKPTVSETRSVSDLVQEESSRGDGSEKGIVRDDNSPALQDPVAGAHGDSSLLATGSDSGRDLDARRSARYQPQTMSLTQGFRTVANQGVNCAIGVAGRPIASATKIGGPAGLMMGLAVAGLGIATAIQKASETQPQQKLCARCDGYGVECCDVCAGAGEISWEGKVHRTNPCPRCFGSRLKKCPRCDGCRVKKDNAPLLLTMKTPPKKK